MENNHIPRHVAIIMDGNGRWAKKRMAPRLFGHHEGAKRVRETVEHSRRIGVSYLTLYAFSSENWNRPEDEISGLFDLLKSYLSKELPTLLKNDIRFTTIGDIAKFPDDIRERVCNAIEATKHCKSMTLIIALSYGSRQEITTAVNKLITEGRKTPVTTDEFSTYLYTSEIPDPDLVIRTSGEFRVSNFLLWQIAYSELYFTDKRWPEFTVEEFDRAVEDYGKRERRYGLTSEQISKGAGK